MRYSTLAGVVALAASMTGCAIFEPTLSPNEGLRNRTRNYELSAEQLQAVPVIATEKTTTTERFDADGRVTERTTIVDTTQRGIPPAVATSEFMASSAFAETELGLNASTNTTGTLVEANRSTKVNEGSYSEGIAGQVARTDITAQLLSDVIAQAATAALGIVTQQETTKRLESDNDKEVRLKEIELAPVEEHAEPVAEAPVPAE